MLPVVVALLLAALALLPCRAGAASLEALRAKGEIVIGLKPDSARWSEAQGSDFAGLEVDLARDVARRLDLTPKFTPARTAQRMDLLELEKVDMLIATLSDTPERRPRIAMAWPAYYATGRNVMAARTRNLKRWQDLEGKRLCGRAGAYYLQDVKSAYHPDLKIFADAAAGFRATREGACWAWLDDDLIILEELRKPIWNDYEMPLATEDIRPWIIAFPKAAAEPLAREVGRAVADWHRTGWLIERHQHWFGQTSAYLEAMHAAWMERNAQGFVCDADAGVTLAAKCGGPAGP